MARAVVNKVGTIMTGAERHKVLLIPAEWPGGHQGIIAVDHYLGEKYYKQVCS